MSQLTFAEAEYTTKKRKTRRELFLEYLDKLLPWKQLETPIAKHYARGGIGRPPYPLSMMLRIHIMQLVYNLSDPAMEDALYEIESMRRFAGVRLDKIPDETTILNFRHLLEKHNLGKKLFQKINKHLDQHGLILREGSIVDATIISAPSSTKNKKGARDPEMHQTRKGEEWHFGMKMHIDVDESLGLIHSVETTPANEHDLNVAHKLLHGDEQRVWADAGYGGAKKRKELKKRNLEWFIGMRPGSRKKLGCSHTKKAEKIKASVRDKVEHAFFYIKRMFGYSKIRYLGLAKNTNRLYVLSGLANLLRCQKYLLA
ncbi:IS5 family transposase [Microbulbifer thermotolerans]|uniref:IS5 family transposase n=2 Tax=Microbulbifer thermotolerans TaxID=252514 RepID=UPI0022488D48|nr:IS5 family transposase [Microbulbifer thermotolerans]MCX2832616.1 IS5 family transposase [Microbulbifer thermotolerans]